MMDFDATSLYPSAVTDEQLVYPKIGTGSAFKPDMNRTYVDAFNNQTFNEDGNESAVLKIKYYNSPNLIFQHISVKEKIKSIETKTMKSGYINDTLTSIDIQEMVKNGEKVIEFYERVVYREKFKISPFQKLTE